MQTTRITHLTALVAMALLAACTSGPVRKAAEAPAPPLHLSIPEHALDVLPIEYLLAAEFALSEDNLGSAAASYLEAALVSDSVDIARRATRLNLAAQRWQDAETALARWRALGAGDGMEILQAEAVLALGQGDADRATAYLQSLLTPGGHAATRSAASALEAAPDRGLALRVLERLAFSPDLPDDLPVLVGLSQLALQTERNDLARALAERATERLPAAPEAWFWRARLANIQGDREQARQLLDQAVASQPDDVDVRRTYSVLLKTELGDTAAAAQALADLPPDEETLALRAAYATEAEDWDQVDEVRRQLQALPLPHSAARLQLLGGLAEMGAEREAESGGDEAAIAELRDEAAGWYEQVGEGDALEYARALQRLAVLDQQRGRLDSARQRLNRLRDHADPDSEAFADTYLLESELLERDGRPEDALAALDLGLAALPDDQRLRYSRGLLNERLDRIEQALDDFRTLTETSPDNPIYLNAYGYTLADRTERYEEALALIELSLSLQPDDVATIDSMGWVLYKLERYDEAVHYLQRAYEEMPDAEIGAHLGEVLWVMGRRDEARAVWRQVQENDPEHRVIRQTLERFRPW